MLKIIISRSSKMIIIIIIIIMWKEEHSILVRMRRFIHLCNSHENFIWPVLSIYTYSQYDWLSFLFFSFHFVQCDRHQRDIDRPIDFIAKNVSIKNALNEEKRQWKLKTINYDSEPLHFGRRKVVIICVHRYNGTDEIRTPSFFTY